MKIAVLIVSQIPCHRVWEFLTAGHRGENNVMGQGNRTENGIWYWEWGWSVTTIINDIAFDLALWFWICLHLSLISGGNLCLGSWVLKRSVNWTKFVLMTAPGFCGRWTLQLRERCLQRSVYKSRFFFFLIASIAIRHSSLS